MEMLTGTDLLDKVKEMGDVSKSELVRSCGYYSLKKDGTERLNFTAFYEALLEAKGVDFNHKGGQPGRAPSFATRVHFNGGLMVGKVYTSQMGLKPGDRFEIKLNKRQICLTPVND